MQQRNQQRVTRGALKRKPTEKFAEFSKVRPEEESPFKQQAEMATTNVTPQKPENFGII